MECLFVYGFPLCSKVIGVGLHDWVFTPVERATWVLSCDAEIPLCNIGSGRLHAAAFVFRERSILVVFGVLVRPLEDAQNAGWPAKVSHAVQGRMRIASAVHPCEIEVPGE